MAEKTVHMKQKFDTIDDLENQCNFIEVNTPGGKLKSLKAVGEAAEHITDGVFERQTGAAFGAGNLKFKEDSTSNDNAWIQGKRTKVSFKRPS